MLARVGIRRLPQALWQAASASAASMESGREYRLDDPTPTVVRTVVTPTGAKLRSHARVRRDSLRKDNPMTTGRVVSARSDLSRFDGFPYLITRVVPGLYHVIVLPAHLPAERYRDLLRAQCEANQLKTCPVLSHSAAWHGGPGGVCGEPCRSPDGRDRRDGPARTARGVRAHT